MHMGIGMVTHFSSCSQHTKDKRRSSGFNGNKGNFGMISIKEMKMAWICDGISYQGIAKLPWVSSGQDISLRR